MKVFLIQFPKLWVEGMALFPFIFVKNKNPDFVLINHEKIHHRQQLEMLILPFYIFYACEYFYRRIKGDRHHEAYKNISFEREAYLHDEDLNYLKNRKIWAFKGYFKEK